MDLHIVQPAIKLSPHELSAFERAHILTIDFLSIEAEEIVKRTSLSLETIRTIVSALNRLSYVKATKTAWTALQNQRFLTSGDAQIDELLGGGVALGHITEFVGESGVGKSQILTQLCVTTQLAEHLGGLSKEVVYISTESGLATSRVEEIAAAYHKRFGTEDLILPSDLLQNIHVVVCPDLELQDHMLYYQLPVLLKQKRNKIGCLVIDSVTANYRAEHSRELFGEYSEVARRAGDMGMRTKDLTRLAAHLRNLAQVYNIAIAVANQVGDRIDREMQPEMLALDHQSQWFNGWDASEHSAKVPALGLIWSNSVHCRIALKRSRVTDDTTRTLTVVYSPFVQSDSIAYKITVDGVTSA